MKAKRLRIYRWLLIGVILVLGVQCSLVSPSPTPTAEPTPTIPAQQGLPFQLVDRSWTEEELLARREQEGAPAWADGDELTFFYQGGADAVHVCCSIESRMWQVEGSDAWSVTLRIDGLSRAVISYGFVPYREGLPDWENATERRVWRGPDAPPALERAESLTGEVQTTAIESEALGEERSVTVYLPPGHDPSQSLPVVYAADGESVDRFAAVLDPLIVEGSVPPFVMVGAHSGGYTGSRERYEPQYDLRKQEYVWGANLERFEAHEQFFVEELSAWAEENLGVSSDRDQRAVFGYSNGGAFAITLGIRHPEQYGNVFAFSAAMGDASWGTPDWTGDGAPRHYLVAGTLEPFRRTTARWARTLSTLEVDHVYQEWVAGHEFVMWQEEFPSALEWAFGE